MEYQAKSNHALSFEVKRDEKTIGNSMIKVGLNLAFRQLLYGNDDNVISYFIF